MRWLVSSTTNLRSLAGQSGVPLAVLQAAGVDPRAALGEVVAASKGEAITRAHAAYPHVPAAQLDVRRLTEPEVR